MYYFKWKTFKGDLIYLQVQLDHFLSKVKRISILHLSVKLSTPPPFLFHLLSLLVWVNLHVQIAYVESNNFRERESGGEREGERNREEEREIFQKHILI